MQCRVYGGAWQRGGGWGWATYSFSRMTSASTLNIWYSPEASFTRRTMELVSCVMGCSVEGQATPWWRCSRSRWTARTEMARGKKGLHAEDFTFTCGEQGPGLEKGQASAKVVHKGPSGKCSLLVAIHSSKTPLYLVLRVKAATEIRKRVGGATLTP